MQGKEIGRYVWEVVPHCKALSSSVYKRREGPLVTGLPDFELLGVYQFWSRVTSVKFLSRFNIFSSSSSLFYFFFFVVGSKAGERRSHDGQVR